MESLKWLANKALDEDIGSEDVTTVRTVPADARCRARLVAKQDGVLSGMGMFRDVLDCAGVEVSSWTALSDGSVFRLWDEVAVFEGKTRNVLTAERTALNFLQHLSGIATLSARYAAAITGLAAKICDTRKTTPLLRRLEKQAVVHGGGVNHRFNLCDGVLIKENHIVAAGGIREALARARAGLHHLLRIEIEVRTLAECEEALDAGAEVVLLDNMSLEDMREAVNRAKGRNVVFEASGNVTLDRVRAIAETGVDLISVGALTHSASASDFSLLLEGACCRQTVAR